jgi:hypothetical protein
LFPEDGPLKERSGESLGVLEGFASDLVFKEFGIVDARC